VPITSSLKIQNGKVAGTSGKFDLSKTLLLGVDAIQRVTMFTPNPYPVRFFGVALQHVGEAQSADGAIDQQRPHSVGDGAGGFDV
jgi:hypothetical protein